MIWWPEEEGGADADAPEVPVFLQQASPLPDLEHQRIAKTTRTMAVDPDNTMDTCPIWRPSNLNPLVEPLQTSEGYWWIHILVRIIYTQTGIIWCAMNKFHMTRNQIILTKESGRVTKILTASRILQISIALCQIKAQIHSFPTMYIIGGGKFGLTR